MSLSPWDLSGNISFDFSLYRPRRPSYVYATQIARRRNESYRHATKSDSNSGEQPFDFIEGIQRKKRKDSYKQATDNEEIELGKVDVTVPVQINVNHVGSVCDIGTVTELTEDETATGTSQPSLADPDLLAEPVQHDHMPTVTITQAHQHGGPDDHDTTETIFTASSEDAVEVNRSKWKYRRNLIVLSLSFILVFSAFRSIQNLQSSLNTSGRLGVIAMGCVHGTMFLTCLFTPVLINKLTSKWTIVLGLLFYLFWIAANFYPHFYTLVPTSIGVGFGQSLAWGAQVTYIQKLAVDYAHLSRELTQQELAKFNGIFLACFQTTHIWGNLVSSLMLSAVKHEPSSFEADGDYTYEEAGIIQTLCGVYDSCDNKAPSVSLWNTSSSAVESPPNAVLKLMGAYLVFAFTGFVVVLMFLEKIGAKIDPEKPCLQMVWNNVRQLVKHRTYRLLIPLLIFNGFEQGFVYADYNKSYISCTIGVEFVGYNMITLGIANVLFSFLVGVISKHLPREAIIGIGGVLHVSILVFLLVWIPDKNLVPVFFVLSALMGVCDAIWQTQCNGLVNLSCPDDHDTAFQNFRMLQGLGAAMAFILGAFVCVAVKLYVIITLLAIAVLCYAFAEHQLRRVDEQPYLDDST